MRITLLVTLALASAAPLAAQTVVVTPSNPQGWSGTSYYASDGWGTNGTGALASITSHFPRAGFGSMEISLADEGLSEADWTYNFASAIDLSGLGALSFDWYTSSASTTPAWTSPAFALAMSDGSYLIWEAAYNGYPSTVPMDQWNTSDILNGNFWLANQPNGCPTATVYQSLSLFNSSCYDNGAQVAGLDVFLGGGYAGTMFDGAADNVTYGVAGAPTTTFNFEPDTRSVVPEPATMSLLAMGLVGLVGTGRRKRAR